LLRWIWKVRPRRLWLAILCIYILPAVACNRPAERTDIVVVKPEVSPHPARIGAVTVMFTLEDGTALPVKGAHVRIEADMSHPGMSPVFAEGSEVEPGHYQSRLALGMAGDWVILIHGTLADGTKVERQFAVNVGRDE
jgi:hypothetical protein